MRQAVKGGQGCEGAHGCARSCPARPAIALLGLWRGRGSAWPAGASPEAPGQSALSRRWSLLASLASNGPQEYSQVNLAWNWLSFSSRATSFLHGGRIVILGRKASQCGGGRGEGLRQQACRKW